MDLTSQFNDLYRTIHHAPPLAYKPSPLTISVMTITGALSHQIRDAQVVHDNIDILEEHGLYIKENCFNNALSVESYDVGGNLKLFTNGSIQFTGAKSIIAFVDIMTRVCTALSGMYEETFSIESAHIQMLNMSFKASVIVGLAKLKTVAERHGCKVTVQTDGGYAGAKIHYADTDGNKISTIMVFHSGHVTISSNRERGLSGIRDGYLFMIHLLREMDCRQPSHEPQTTARTKGWGIHNGYSNTLTRLCVLDMD